MSYAKGKNFNVVFLPLRFSAGDTYRGSGLVIQALIQISNKNYAVVKSPDIPICKLLAKCQEIISLVDFLSLFFQEICDLTSSHEY